MPYSSLTYVARKIEPWMYFSLLALTNCIAFQHWKYLDGSFQVNLLLEMSIMRSLGNPQSVLGSLIMPWNLLDFRMRTFKSKRVPNQEGKYHKFGYSQDQEIPTLSNWPEISEFFLVIDYRLSQSFSTTLPSRRFEEWFQKICCAVNLILRADYWNFLNNEEASHLSYCETNQGFKENSNCISMVEFPLSGCCLKLDNSWFLEVELGVVLAKN